MKATQQGEIRYLKVAYADDHVAVRKGIIAYLQEAEDIQVIIEADNGRALIQKIAESAEPPDICMLDMQMPEMNGLETVLAIRKKWSKMKFLVLSVYDDERYVMQMVRAGVSGYLSKSDNPDEIKKALWSIQEKGIYYSELFMKSTLRSAQNQAASKPVSLSAREKIVLKHCCSDLTYTQIAEKMKCTLKSVEGQRDSICRKLNIRSRSGMVLYAIQSGLVPIDTNLLFI